MKTQVKRRFAKLLLSVTKSRFDESDNCLYQLFGRAISLQMGRISDEEFRQSLDHYFSEVNLQDIQVDLDFTQAIQKLNRPGGYKSPVIRLRSDPPERGWRRRYTPWGRRYSLLGRIGISVDVMILRQGITIPPHGHHQVVSGFYVLEGAVAVRHYDRMEDLGTSVRVRKTIDTVMRPGGYTTNSEFHDNIHWLQGIADASYLFRLNVKNTPATSFGMARGDSERIYVDPTAAPESDGTIIAKYVDEYAAKRLTIQPETKCAALLES